MSSPAAPSQGNVFELHRAYLIGVGYRMLGSLAASTLRTKVGSSITSDRN